MQITKTSTNIRLTRTLSRATTLHTLSTREKDLTFHYEFCYLCNSYDIFTVVALSAAVLSRPIN